jgi:osmotically-inducible protein OsmY
MRMPPMDRNRMLSRVEAAIGREAGLDMHAHPLSLDLADGVLTVSGEVARIATKKLALRAAAGVAGIEQVQDRIHVAAGQPPGDGATRDAVCRALLHEIDFQNCGVQARVKGQGETLRTPGRDASGAIAVAVENGVVTLAGHVISLSHKRLAGALAWWAPGCRNVVNALQVVPPEDDNDDEIVDALRLVLESDPYVHAERVAVSSRDRVVTLEGVVASPAERERAEEDAWGLFAVDKVVNRLEVR